MSSTAPTLVEELGDALREVRWRLRVSQRELADQLGVSKTWVGRLESGEVSAALAAVSRLVADLGLRLALSVDDDVHAPRGSAPPADDDRSVVALGAEGVDTATDAVRRGSADAWGSAVVDAPVAGAALADDAAARSEDLGVAVAGSPVVGVAGRGSPGRPVVGVAGRGSPGRFYTDDPEALAQVERWRLRAERERVRDAAGRRLPAHLVAYPMSYPHHWWFLRHHGWSLRRRPIWSFVRGTPYTASVLQIGDNPPPLGLHPDGGWPMQGRPGPEIRAAWPPTFPYRPRRYADPLRAA